MRFLPGLVLIVALAAASTAEARLFWQSYGSLAPAAGGGDCTWNWNQDYFVPRYPSSGHYGLYSPCKSSCTRSAACRSGHPLYAGYCNIYGPCHYRRRDHVYAAYCGCRPLLLGRGCGAASGTACGTDCGVVGGSLGTPCCEPVTPLHNVEPAHFDILGSIPVEGGVLVTTTDFSQLDDERSMQQLLQQQRSVPLLQGLPSFGLPSSGQPTQP